MLVFFSSKGSEVNNMHISMIEIRNFRGIDITLEKINNVVTVIGQNDSGKSNICAAILKVLDYNKRRIPLFESDSTNSNKKNIFIKIKLEIDDLTDEQLAQLHEVISEKDGKKYVYAQLTSTYNTDVLIYEDELLIGDMDLDYKEYNTTKQNPLDKVLSVIYINPTYDTKQETKHFFEYKEARHIEMDTHISPNIEETIEKLKENVKNDEALAEIINDINELGEFEKMFDGMKFELTPNIKLENIYKSLEISTLDSYGNVLNNIGDGKNKIFSMLLKEKTYEDDKKKIIIVEEPENHLYVLLQKHYISAIASFKPSQMIVTTHSPHVVDFEKTNQIIKIQRYFDSQNEVYRRKKFVYNVENEEFSKYGYLINVEIAEMMYYDMVLLIEGESEKYFYSYLLSQDPSFRNMVFNNNIGIFSVNGIAFKKIKELLEALGIKVYIKTDNDIFKVPSKSNLYYYAGITRCINYLDNEGKTKIKNILGIEDLSNIKNFQFANRNDKIKLIEENIDKLCDVFKESRILLSKHNLGFEKDFLDYIQYNENDYEEVIKNLKDAKLTNLHRFIIDRNIDIKINEVNKNSVLLGFINYDR